MSCHVSEVWCVCVCIRLMISTGWDLSQESCPATDWAKTVPPASSRVWSVSVCNHVPLIIAVNYVNKLVASWSATEQNRESCEEGDGQEDFVRISFHRLTSCTWPSRRRPCVWVSVQDGSRSSNSGELTDDNESVMLVLIVITTIHCMVVIVSI